MSISDEEYNPKALQEQMIQVEKEEESDYDDEKLKKQKRTTKKKEKKDEKLNESDENNEDEDFQEPEINSGDDYEDDLDFEEESFKKSKKLRKANEKPRKVKSKKQKKKKKEKNFFEDEASDAEDEEEESIEGEMTKKELNEYKIKNDIKRKKVDIAKTLEDKYKGIDEREIADEYEDDLREEEYKDEINDKQPKHSDPKLWLVKCKMGKERDSVNELLHKFFFNNKSNHLKIFSVISIDALKGSIYIEAYKEANVKEAIAGMSNLKENSIKIVPQNEMIQVFNYDKLEKIDIKKGQWVRVKSGLYENDLAQIIDIEDSSNKIYIKIIPRIFELTGKESIGDYSKQMKGNLKPKQQFFNPNIHGSKELKRHNFLQENLYYWRNKYYKDGFLIKSVKAKSLLVDDIIPKIDELRIFESANEEKQDKNNIFDSILSINEANSKRSKFNKGDKVKIIKGNLNIESATVVSHNNNVVTVVPNIQGFSSEIDIPESYCIKTFLPGDLITVDKGNHIGKTGLVVKIDDDVVVIFSEATNTEFKVSVSDIVHASKVVKDKSENCSFQLEDLVKINGTSIYSFILDIQGHSLKLLDFNNQIKIVSSRDVTRVTGK